LPARCFCAPRARWHSSASAGRLGVRPAGLRATAWLSLASETRTYDLRDDGYLVNVVILKAPNGHPDFIQVVSKSDGKDYPQYSSVTLAEFQINSTKTPLT
jgi:hypothetical protein